MYLNAAKRQLDKLNLGPEEYNCGLIMIGAWRISKDANEIANWMRFPVKYVSVRLDRLVQNGLVTEHGIMSDWNDWAVFALDLLVCQGFITKHGEQYTLTDAGKIASRSV